jgi:hypothetical protein
MHRSDLDNVVWHALHGWRYASHSTVLQMLPIGDAEITARRGLTSFLHVSDTNTVARKLYESMGLAVRASLRLGKIERESIP